METVQVLLSTYNGEKYLREQLDSLLKQQDIKIKISVRDDGSTDTTLDILEEYRKKGILEYYAEENIGYTKSFLTLATYCTNKADYYAFCDQDDFWKSEKLIAAVKKLKENKLNKPMLYFSNIEIVNENLVKFGFKDYSNMNLKLKSAMVRHNISGCVMVFNEELLKLAIKNKCYTELKIGHDAWIYRVCLCVGGQIVFDSNSYIKYRQHKKNVTGVSQGIIKRISRELKVFTSKKNKNLECVEIILSEYYDLISEDNLIFLKEISAYKSSIIRRIKLIFKKDFIFGVKLIDVFIKIQILLGCY